jgi:hypothetical protein
MTGTQRIVALAGTGGGLVLVGVESKAGWKLRVETDESALSGLLDEGDPIELPERPRGNDMEERSQAAGQLPVAAALPARDPRGVPQACTGGFAGPTEKGRAG